MDNKQAIENLEKIATELSLYKLTENINNDLFKKILEITIKKLTNLLSSIEDNNEESDFNFLKSYLLEHNFPFCEIILDIIAKIDFGELDPKEIFKGA